MPILAPSENITQQGGDDGPASCAGRRGSDRDGSACHGKPKGGLHIVNFEKGGLEAGDLIGPMNVTIAVSD